MSLFTIDKEKCIKDGMCAKDCPNSIIGFDTDGYPELIPGNENKCWHCGHCVAVCSRDAMHHVDSPLADSPLIDKGLNVSEGQLEQLIRSRRSIRQYTDKPVEQGTLQRLIEIAGHAPTGINMQMLEWLVINGRDRVKSVAQELSDRYKKALDGGFPQIPEHVLFALREVWEWMIEEWDKGNDQILRGAPCLMVALYPSISPYGLVELSSALTHLSLAAPVFGLGTCWAGIVQFILDVDPTFKKVVGVPDNDAHYFTMMLGYPDVRYYRMPKRNAPKITWQ